MSILSVNESLQGVEAEVKAAVEGLAEDLGDEEFNAGVDSAISDAFGKVEQDELKGSIWKEVEAHLDKQIEAIWSYLSLGEAAPPRELHDRRVLPLHAQEAPRLRRKLFGAHAGHHAALLLDLDRGQGVPHAARDADHAQPCRGVAKQ